MRKTSLLVWFFLLFLIITLKYSAYGSTHTEEEAHSEKQPKGMIMESSKAGINKTTYPGMHVVQHGTTSRRARAIYGGANDIRRPRGKNSANSLSIKHSSLFMAALSHLIFGLVLVACFL